MTQLPGGWPPPAPVPIKDGCQLRPGEDGGESPWLLVKRQLCGLVKQRKKETAAAEEATEGGSNGRGRSPSQRGSQAASTSGAAIAGRKRARDPT